LAHSTVMLFYDMTMKWLRDGARQICAVTIHQQADYDPNSTVRFSGFPMHRQNLDVSTILRDKLVLD